MGQVADSLQGSLDTADSYFVDEESKQNGSRERGKKLRDAENNGVSQNPVEIVVGKKVFKMLEVIELAGENSCDARTNIIILKSHQNSEERGPTEKDQPA